MPNLFTNKVEMRRPNEMPPNFTPEKNQGTPIMQEPGPVVEGSGIGQGPGVVIIGPGQGPGFGPGQGPGFGPGQGPGFGPGQGPGFGPGQGPGFGPGQGPGFGPGGFYWQNMANKIRPCRGRFTYLWLRNGAEFWFYIETVTPRYIYGWRFRRGRWEDGRIALNRIDRFYCYRRD